MEGEGPFEEADRADDAFVFNADGLFASGADEEVFGAVGLLLESCQYADLISIFSAVERMGEQSEKYD